MAKYKCKGEPKGPVSSGKQHHLDASDVNWTTNPPTCAVCGSELEGDVTGRP